MLAFAPLCEAGDEAADLPRREFPPELVRFTPYENNPVFTATSGEWDARIRERGWILHGGNRWQLWYTGYDGTPEGKRKLGHATSTDGLHWDRDGRNPIYDDHTIEDMMVVRHDGRWYMFAEEGDLSSQWLTSEDGVNWKREGTIDIHRAGGGPISTGPFGTPTAWFEGDTWYLMYERGDRAIYLAKSGDLKTWTNVQDEPVLEPGPGEYDKLFIAVNQVIKYDGRYYAYYHGSGTPMKPRMWTTNIAVSADRIHWQKYGGNPIVPGDRSSGIVVPVDGSQASGEIQFEAHRPRQFRLYTMHDKVEVFLPAAK
jgi:predicted GH43/DUF377 family glycosyl hydrolase